MVSWYTPFIPFLFFAPQSNWNEIVDNFDDMNLKESLLRGIYAYGFEKPSAIQQRAIIPCIKGKRISCHFEKMNSLFYIDLDHKRENSFWGTSTYLYSLK